MANKNIRGTNPQNLIEKIVRSKVRDHTYWKEQCFGLTAETLVDKAIELDHIGGTYGGNRKPTPFLCLVLKMLQIQPEKEIVIEFIKNEDFKYVRVLGAFYLRLTGTDTDVYSYLEPLYNDFRKLRMKNQDGRFFLTHVDEFIHDLITKDYLCDVAMPRIKKRLNLEIIGILVPRISALEDDFDFVEEMDVDDDDEREKDDFEDYHGGSGCSIQLVIRKQTLCVANTRVRPRTSDPPLPRDLREPLRHWGKRCCCCCCRHDSQRYRDKDFDRYGGRLRDGDWDDRDTKKDDFEDYRGRSHVRDRRGRDRHFEDYRDRERYYSPSPSPRSCGDDDDERDKDDFEDYRGRSPVRDRRGRDRDWKDYRDRDWDHRRKRHYSPSRSPRRRGDDDDDDGGASKKSKKDDGTDHPDPEIAEANKLRVKLGLKPLRL